MSDLLSAARTAVNQCLGAKRGEKFLVITDEPLRPIGQAFFAAGPGAGCEPTLGRILPPTPNGPRAAQRPSPAFWDRFALPPPPPQPLPDPYASPQGSQRSGGARRHAAGH